MTGVATRKMGRPALVGRHEDMCAARDFALSILESETYRNNIRLRANTGTLPPALEMMLWHYAYGKPQENVQISFPNELPDELAVLGVVALTERAALLTEELRKLCAPERTDEERAFNTQRGKDLAYVREEVDGTLILKYATPEDLAEDRRKAAELLNAVSNAIAGDENT